MLLLLLGRPFVPTMECVFEKAAGLISVSSHNLQIHPAARNLQGQRLLPALPFNAAAGSLVDKAEAKQRHPYSCEHSTYWPC